jgi:hypothetical protein
MSKLSCAVVALAALLAVPIMRPQSVSSSDLPEGPLQAKAITACTECHEARIILQQRLNEVAWAKEVDKMIKWGALVEPQDHDPLIDYLSTNFGVDKPEYVADRTGSANPRKTKK